MERLFIILFIGLFGLVAASCTNQVEDKPNNGTVLPAQDTNQSRKDGDFTDASFKTIYFAGGCFWGVEAFFKEIPGVYEATSGYANGNGGEPSYREVMKGDNGFVETVEVTYDSKQVALNELMDYFFMVIDPTSVDQQGNDIGVQYRTGIYYKEAADQPTIEKRIDKEQERYEDPIATEVEPLQNYYLAEEEHQDYLAKNPNGYCHIDLDVLDEIKK